ncbi:MAG TPA: TlpA disulfide reductase family protein [Pyrinomonadaceae bacterium]|nr:TlpA disulfide reductase family protein [Pyrinomonadaceae bacterium]
MRTLMVLLILAATSALTLAVQSGRKISTARTAPTAPIQAPLTPEPEPPVAASPVSLMSIPESYREREIRSLNKGSFKLSDFYGKVIVINLWASWCGPCRREVPEYEQVRKSYAGQNVEFIGLTTEDPRSSSGSVNKFLREVNFGFRLGWADRDLARLLMNGRGSIPQTIVLDSRARIVRQWAGYSAGHSGDRLTASIEEALKGG